jgi:hypothetical protein
MLFGNMPLNFQKTTVLKKELTREQAPPVDVGD